MNSIWQGIKNSWVYKEAAALCLRGITQQSAHLVRSPGFISGTVQIMCDDRYRLGAGYKSS